MRKFKTIYKHVGYFNDYTSIQDMCEKCPDIAKKIIFKGSIAIEMFKNDEGIFMPNIDPVEDDVLILEDEKECYISNDKKYVVTNSVYDGIFDVDVDSDEYDPNNVDCDCYVDIWEFDHIESCISLNDLRESAEPMDTIVIGMSFDSRVTDKATSWHTFKRCDYHNFDEWVEHVYREFYFQLNRDDVFYLELTAQKTDVLFKS